MRKPIFGTAPLPRLVRLRSARRDRIRSLGFRCGRRGLSSSLRNGPGERSLEETVAEVSDDLKEGAYILSVP